MTHIKTWFTIFLAKASIMLASLGVVLFAVGSLHAEEPSPAPKASASHMNGSLDALNDGIEPKN